MQNLVGKKYDEKQDMYIVSKYLPLQYFELLTGNSTFTVESPGR